MHPIPLLIVASSSATDSNLAHDESFEFFVICNTVGAPGKADSD